MTIAILAPWVTLSHNIWDSAGGLALGAKDVFVGGGSYVGDAESVSWAWWFQFGVVGDGTAMVTVSVIKP